MLRNKIKDLKVKLAARRKTPGLSEFFQDPSQEPVFEDTEMQEPQTSPREPDTPVKPKQPSRPSDLGPITQRDLDYFNLESDDLPKLNEQKIRSAMRVFLVATNNRPPAQREKMLWKFLNYMREYYPKQHDLILKTFKAANNETIVDLLKPTETKYLSPNELEKLFDVNRRTVNFAAIGKEEFENLYESFKRNTSDKPDDSSIIAPALRQILADPKAPDEIKKKASITLSSEKFRQMDTQLLNVLDERGVLRDTKADSLFRLLQEIRDAKKIRKGESFGKLPFEEKYFQKTNPELFKMAYTMANAEKAKPREKSPDAIMDVTQLPGALKGLKDEIDHYIETVEKIDLSGTASALEDSLVGADRGGKTIPRTLPTKKEISSFINRMNEIANKLNLTEKDIKRAIEILSEGTSFRMSIHKEPPLKKGQEKESAKTETKKPDVAVSLSKEKAVIIAKTLMGLLTKTLDNVKKQDHEKAKSYALELVNKTRATIENLLPGNPRINNEFKSIVDSSTKRGELAPTLNDVRGLARALGNQILNPEEGFGVFDALKISVRKSIEKEQEKEKQGPENVARSLDEKVENNPELYQEFLSSASEYIDFINKKQIEIYEALNEHLSTDRIKTGKKFLKDIIDRLRSLLDEPVFQTTWKGVTDVMDPVPERTTEYKELLDEYSEKSMSPEAKKRRRQKLFKLQRSDAPKKLIEEERKRIEQLEKEYEAELPLILEKLRSHDVDPEKIQEETEKFEKEKTEREKVLEEARGEHVKERAHKQLIEEINETFRISLPIEKPQDPGMAEKYEETVESYKEKLEKLQKEQEEQPSTIPAKPQDSGMAPVEVSEGAPISYVKHLEKLKTVGPSERYEKELERQKRQQQVWRKKKASQDIQTQYENKIEKLIESLVKTENKFEELVKDVGENSIIAKLQDKIYRMSKGVKEIKEEDVQLLEDALKELEKIYKQFNNFSEGETSSNVLSKVHSVFEWLADLSKHVSVNEKNEKPKTRERAVKEIKEMRKQAKIEKNYYEMMKAAASIKNLADILFAKSAARTRGRELSRAVFPGRTVVKPLGTAYVDRFWEGSGFEQKFFARLMDLGAHMLGNTTRKTVGGFDEVVDKAIEEASNGKYFTLDQFLGMGAVNEQKLRSQIDNIDKELKNRGFDPDNFDGLRLNHDLEIEDKGTLAKKTDREGFVEIIKAFQPFLTDPLTTVKNRVSENVSQLLQDVQILENRLGLNPDGYENLSEQVNKSKGRLYSGDDYEIFRKAYNRHAEKPKKAKKAQLPSAENLEEVIDSIGREIDTHQRILNISKDVEDLRYLQQRLGNNPQKYQRLVQDVNANPDKYDDEEYDDFRETYNNWAKKLNDGKNIAQKGKLPEPEHLEEVIQKIEEQAGPYPRTVFDNPTKDMLKRKEEKTISAEDYAKMVANAKKTAPIIPEKGRFERKTELINWLKGRNNIKHFEDVEMPKTIWDELYEMEKKVLAERFLPLLNKRQELLENLASLSFQEELAQGKTEIPQEAKRTVEDYQNAVSKIQNQQRRIKKLQDALAFASGEQKSEIEKQIQEVKSIIQRSKQEAKILRQKAMKNWSRVMKTGSEIIGFNVYAQSTVRERELQIMEEGDPEGLLLLGLIRPDVETRNPSDVINRISKEKETVKKELQATEEKLKEAYKRAEATMLKRYLELRKEQGLPLEHTIKIQETQKDRFTGEKKKVEKTETRPIRRYVFMTLFSWAPFTESLQDIEKEAAARTERDKPENTGLEDLSWIKAPEEDRSFLKKYKNWDTFEDYLDDLKEKLETVRKTSDPTTEQGRKEITEIQKNLEAAQRMRNYPIVLDPKRPNGDPIEGFPMRLKFEHLPSKFKKLLQDFFDVRSRALADRVVKDSYISQLAKKRIAIKEMLGRSETAKEEERNKKIKEGIAKAKASLETMRPEKLEKLPENLTEQLDKLEESGDYSNISKEVKNFLAAQGINTDPVKWNILTPNEMTNLKNIFWNKLYHFLDDHYWSRSMAENVVGLGPRDEAWYDNVFNTFQKYRVVFNNKYRNQTNSYLQSFKKGKKKAKTLVRDMKAIVKTLNDLGIETEDIKKQSPTAWKRILEMRTMIETMRKHEYQYQKLFLNAVKLSAQKMLRKKVDAEIEKNEEALNKGEPIEDQLRKEIVVDFMAPIDRFLGLDNTEYTDDDEREMPKDLRKKTDELKKEAEKEEKFLQELMEKTDNILGELKGTIENDFEIPDFDSLFDDNRDATPKTLEDFPTVYAHLNDRSLLSALRDRIEFNKNTGLSDIFEISKQLENIEKEISEMPDSVLDDGEYDETTGEIKPNNKARIADLKSRMDEIKQAIINDLQGDAGKPGILGEMVKGWSDSFKREYRALEKGIISDESLRNIIKSKSETLRRLNELSEFAKTDQVEALINKLNEFADKFNDLLKKREENKNVEISVSEPSPEMKSERSQIDIEQSVKEKKSYREDKNFDPKFLYGSTIQRTIKELLRRTLS